METTSAERSLWLAAARTESYPRLEVDRLVDVAVLGGGITGLTTALMLARRGAEVAVIEADRIGSGATGNNTAKVTALQSTMYSALERRHGRSAAADYAAASAAAVQRVAVLAEQEGIDCALQRRAALTVAMDDTELPAVQREAEAAGQAGLPVQWTDKVDLPFPVSGAVSLPDQIALHPVRYVRGLAAALVEAGSQVYETTRAVQLHEGRPCRVVTTGGTVYADQVVVATHYPLFDRGVYFARLQAQRSYCVAARVSDELPTGMSINTGSPTRSLNAYGEFLIVGGESHRSGAKRINDGRYRRLEAFARSHWDVTEIPYRWSAQDPVSYDQLPVVGCYTPRSSRVFVASGFMKWGLTGGTMAALALSDLVSGSEPAPWARRFTPNRISLRSLPKLLTTNAQTGADLVLDRITPAEVSDPADVPAGQARTVRDRLARIGVFREPDGTLHAVSLRCTHLGCLLRFNGAERSWDCPCHGSRFTVDGAVLEGPATRPLPRHHFADPAPSDTQSGVLDRD